MILCKGLIFSIAIVIISEDFGNGIITSAKKNSGSCPDINGFPGKVRYKRRGTKAQFRCPSGSIRYGKKFLICQADNTWDGEPPACIRPGCVPIDISSQENLDMTEKKGGALLQFSCENGYQLIGVKETFCDGVRWSAPLPSCIATADLTECDFETDLCGWSQETQDDQRDWTRNIGTTSTGSTGPKHDHTEGESGNGHYLYFESSTPTVGNDEAWLISPKYTPDMSPACFDFWYHMFGPDEQNMVGSLSVYVRGVSKFIDKVPPVFHKEGNQGNVWKRGNTQVEEQDEDFQIIIVGIRKRSYFSDIAIDDVRLYNCSENTTDSTTEPLPQSTTIITTEAPTPPTTQEQTSAPMPQTPKQPKTTKSITTPKQVTTPSSPTKPPETSPTTKPNTKASTTQKVTTKPKPKTTKSTTKTQKIATTPTTTTSTTTTTTTTSTTTTKPTTELTTSTTQPTTKATVPVSTAQSTKPTTLKQASKLTTVKATSKQTSLTTAATTSTTEVTSQTSTVKTSKTTRPIVKTSPAAATTQPTTTVPTIASSTTSRKATLTTTISTTERSTTKMVETTTPTRKAKTTQNTEPPKATTLAPTSSKVSSQTPISVTTVQRNGSVRTTKASRNLTTVPPVAVNQRETHPEDDTLKPLMIGLGVGIIAGLIIIGVVAWVCVRRRKFYTRSSEDELKPITNSESVHSLNNIEFYNDEEYESES